MDIVYDSSKFNVNDIIIIEDISTPRRSMPLAGILHNPPVKDGALQFMAIDGDRRAIGFRSLLLDVIGVTDGEADDATAFRTYIVNDPNDLYHEYQLAVERYVKGRENIRERRQSPTHVSYVAAH